MKALSFQSWFRSLLALGSCYGLLFLQARVVPAGPVTALAFSKDDSLLVSAGGKTLDLRSPQDGLIQKSIPCSLAKVSSLAFSPRHASLLAVAGGLPGVEGQVLLLNLASQQPTPLPGTFQDLATSVAFNADGSFLGVASADGAAVVYRLGDAQTNLTRHCQLIGHSGPVLGIAFSPSSSTVLTAGADRSIKVWALDDGRLLRSFNHHTERVNTLQFRPASDPSLPVVCASASDDRTVRIWQPEIGRMVRIIRGHEAPIFAIAWSPDGAALYSAGQEGVIRCIDSDSDKILRQWRASEDWIYTLALRHDGSALASGDWAGQVKVWPLQERPGGDQTK